MHIKRFNKLYKLTALVFATVICATMLAAQNTNPVEEKVANPVTDTPSVNPLAQDNLLPPKKPTAQISNSEDLIVDSGKQTASGPENARIFVNEGNVDIKLGIYRIQADKITVYENENRVVAEGSVVFDQGTDQRITGTRGDWNYKTKLGVFENSTGFTNQTTDGTIIFFTADRVERVALDRIVLTNAKITACGDDLKPKWSFTTNRADIKTNDRVKLKTPAFRVLDVPLIKLPYASIPIKRRDRASGFLTPTVSAGGNRGFRLSNAYYQTLGESADITLRSDIFSTRGLGIGFDVRTRANDRSYFNFGFYAVKDRIFGAKESAANPDQGGTSIYADGVQYFPNGFVAAADVKITSNLAFRQVFSDRIQQVISPIENSQIFINKSWNNYSLDFLARSQVISLPNFRVSTRNLPSVAFEKRPSSVSFFKDLPIYFTFKTSLGGVARRETAENPDTFFSQYGYEPLRSPALGQRLDIHPQVLVPLNFAGFTLTTTGGLRSTFYSDSIVRNLRQSSGRDLIRRYAEAEFDFRPPALAKNYKYGDGLFRFRHVIEPFLKYKVIKGIGTDFERVIRFDEEDTVTDTNEIEYGITNRFYTRRYTEIPSENISRETLQDLAQNPTTPLSIQPYEIFTLTIRGKYFFDKTFGGALIPGRRNQIAPITDLTAFTFGGVPRNFSPVNVDFTYRPRRTIYANSRLDFGGQKAELRNLSVTLGYDTQLVKIFQTFYYTRAISLIPSLQRFGDATGREAGTQRGSQFSPSIFIGNRERGFFGGTSLFFDFQNTRIRRVEPLISSTTTLGYAYDCCSVVLQYSTYNVSLRRENRLLFSFKLNGIGSFGTEQYGQGLR